jgi:hypothetical protein
MSGNIKTKHDIFLKAARVKQRFNTDKLRVDTGRTWLGKKL